MVKMTFTDEEIQEAVKAVPDGWGWHILALANGDPSIGHRVHHTQAMALEKIGVIGKVPMAGGGPWYAVTKLGQAVAEYVGLRLVKEGFQGVRVREVEQYDLPPGEWFRSIVFGAGMDSMVEAKCNHSHPTLYLHVNSIGKVPCEVMETADLVKEVRADGSIFIHKDRLGLYKHLGRYPAPARVSLDVRAFMALDEDARASVCMAAGLALPDSLDQMRGDRGWLTVLEPLSGDGDLTLKVSQLIQEEMDAPAEQYGTISKEHKGQFRTGWLSAVSDIRHGEDNSESVGKDCSPWVQCGYFAAFNRWNGTITRYTKLGTELGCEEPKGPKQL